jgi:hypothetical protein
MFLILKIRLSENWGITELNASHTLMHTCLQVFPAGQVQCGG